MSLMEPKRLPGEPAPLGPPMHVGDAVYRVVRVSIDGRKRQMYQRGMVVAETSDVGVVVAWEGDPKREECLREALLISRPQALSQFDYDAWAATFDRRDLERGY